jgi:hypothetical protein
LVVGPDGRAAVQGRFGEEADELLLVDVTPVPRPARGAGWARLTSRG